MESLLETTGMDEGRNGEFLSAQFTIAHWYLDRAKASKADGRYRYLAYAREACDIIVHLLPELNLGTEKRQQMRSDLKILHARFGEPAADE